MDSPFDQTDYFFIWTELKELLPDDMAVVAARLNWDTEKFEWIRSTSAEFLDISDIAMYPPMGSRYRPHYTRWEKFVMKTGGKNLLKQKPADISRNHGLEVRLSNASPCIMTYSFFKMTSQDEGGGGGGWPKPALIRPSWVAQGGGGGGMKQKNSIWNKFTKSTYPIFKPRLFTWYERN